MSTLQKVFITDDDLDDHLLYRMAFERSNVGYEIELFSEGQKLLDYLAELLQHPDDPNAIFPSLVQLDMYMPGKSGLETLAELRQNEFLAGIPVVMLFSALALPEDIKRGYEMGAARIAEKPIDLGGFIELLETLEEYF